MEETKVEVDTKASPWDVTSVEAFLYYNCPECEVKSKDVNSFMSHAIEHHEIARYYVSQYDQEPMEDNEALHDIKPEIELHEDEYIEEQPLFDDMDYEPEVKIHKCDICEFECDKASKLAAHTRKEHPIKVTPSIKCDQCDYTGRNMKLLRRHKERMHVDYNSPKNTCKDCGLQCETKDKLYYHRLKNHRNDKKMSKCDKCDFEAATYWQIKKHKQQEHDEQANHVCHICSKGFLLPAILSNHIDRVHNKVGQSVVCEKCGKSYDNALALKDHMFGVHKVFFLCTLCEQIFTSRSKLKLHLTNEHKLACDIHHVCICPQCQRCFKTSSDVNDHLRNEHGLQNQHSCPKCDKRFPLKPMLTLHQIEMHDFDPRKDTDVVPNAKVIGAEKVNTNSFECDICHKMFLNYRTLYGHKKQFHDAHNYKCDQCDFTTYENHKLIKHIEIKHMKPFKYPCAKCSYITNCRSSYNMHIKRSHENKGKYDHPCAECDMTFRTKGKLADHLLAIHSVILKY